MSHDIYASWASTEITRMINQNSTLIFNTHHNVTAYAGREGRTYWPLADGVISVEVNGSTDFNIALEFKKVNEGLHGILTALGQAHAYLHKGYDASFIVIPEEYSSHNQPGLHLNKILEYCNPNISIGIITYTEPDTSITSPFENKLTFIRKINLNSIHRTTRQTIQNTTTTQWAHLREGISSFSWFFRYLQSSKKLDLNNLTNPDISYLPQEILDAVETIQPGSEPLKYLSQTPYDNFKDYVWRNFWFNYILHEGVVNIWSEKNPNYIVNTTPSKLEKDEGNSFCTYFSNRSDSIKVKLVNKLNNGIITEEDAWIEFAKVVHKNAHSYKEIIDSGLEHLRLLGNDGKPTEVGYKYVDACERNSNIAYAGTPKLIFAKTLLESGQLNALLHYIYKLSDLKFKENSLAFTEQRGIRIVFMQNDYLDWLANELANNLNVMKTSTIRGGTSRKPFQAELSLLRKISAVDNFRIGIGLEINWPLIQSILDTDI